MEVFEELALRARRGVIAQGIPQGVDLTDYLGFVPPKVRIAAPCERRCDGVDAWIRIGAGADASCLWPAARQLRPIAGATTNNWITRYGQATCLDAGDD